MLFEYLLHTLSLVLGNIRELIHDPVNVTLALLLNLFTQLLDSVVLFFVSGEYCECVSDGEHLLCGNINF